MNAYIYQADLLCESCACEVIEELRKKNQWPDNVQDESTYDSDDYPKGPYSDGGGEADCPQHCGNCGLFLENPLTLEGENYVIEAVNDGSGEVIELWRDYYYWLFLEQQNVNLKQEGMKDD